jgi:hypothetical protein
VVRGCLISGTERGEGKVTFSLKKSPYALLVRDSGRPRPAKASSIKVEKLSQNFVKIAQKISPNPANFCAE